MKKVIDILLFLAACKADSRTYVNHTEGLYSIADETLIIQGYLIINRSGFQKILNGKASSKKYNIKQWRTGKLDAPVVRTDGKHAYWNNTIYHLVP